MRFSVRGSGGYHDVPPTGACEKKQQRDGVNSVKMPATCSHTNKNHELSPQGKSGV